MRPKTNSRGPHKSVGVNCNNLLGDEGETEDFEKYNYGENENENRPNSQMYRVVFFLNVKLRGPESQIMDEKVMSGHFEGQSEYF